MEPLFFHDQIHFHQWLAQYHRDHPGVWIMFDKTHTKSRLTPEEALDEALCFGWIDGQIKRLDEMYYLKYFAKRTPKSIWSSKNKQSVARLINEGRMMSAGYVAVESAKRDGRWDKADQDPVDYSRDDFIRIISLDPDALHNFMNMSLSIQKTYALSYYVLKKEASRQKRLSIIIERLKNNLKPM